VSVATLTAATAAPAAGTAPWLDDFAALARELPDEPDAIVEVRRRALERFAEVGFPTLRWEEWRRTDVRPISEGRFRRATGPGPVAAAVLAPHLFDAFRLVVVDGFPVPELSDLVGLPPGVRLGSLAAALAAEPDRVVSHLACHARPEDNPFTALNTAFFSDGAWLELAPRTVVDRPIHLLFVSTVDPGDTPRAAWPRNLVVAGEASEVTVVETWIGAADGAYLTCPVTEVVAGPGAVVDHYKVQHESPRAFHLATLQIDQQRSSSLFSHSVSTGGAITRNDVNAVLAGEGGECTLNGLYLVADDQLVDNHMRVDHVAAHCNSYELYKGILDGRSRAVFNGRIHVHKGAQKTDAKQSNRNLLLSRGALAASNPQLEIFADDVRCTHGSTVGQLDDDAVFYLRSRGIGEAAARSLLTYAFASDIIGRIKVEPVRRRLEELMFARLPRGEVVRQAV
jgi:Fe-S cluster assembly protein SufD